MSEPVPPPDPGHVEEFRRKHRTGLVTLLFTDMVESTSVKQRLGDSSAADVFRRHHELLRGTLQQFPQAEEIETAGDSFMLIFATPSDAAQFALLVQERLRHLRHESGAGVVDRIGIHLGEVVVGHELDSRKPRDLFGIQIDTCARVMSMARAGQVLMTRAVFDSARPVLKGENIPGVGPLEWLNHGPYVLKGLDETVEICEVREAGQKAQGPPPNSEKAQRKVSADEEPVLGWRPALEQAVPGTKWTLEKKLGEGGFGEVWLGRHATLKERRVFKFCFRADRVRSLKREVTLFRVMKEKVGQHPNIVGIQEVFFDEPPFYIVMDYAEGQDLRAWCEAQGGVDKIPLATRLEIVAQVADALQAAHEAGVIHRDVKPSNILVSGQWSVVSGEKQQGSPEPSAADSSLVTRPSSLAVKLTDFGIGQVVSQEALAGMTKMGFTQTMLGPGSSSHTGTQLYMAPELMAGQPASAQSDLYSLGVVLYQLAIGDFGRPLTTDWARRVNDPVLREDLEKCFAGDLEERFASAGELARSVRSLEDRQSELVVRHAAVAAQEKGINRRRAVRRVSAIAAVVGLIAGLAIYAFSHAWHPIPTGTKSLAVLPFASGDKENDYFARQMSGELIVKLSKIGGLKVTPLTRVLVNTNLGTSLSRIGGELGVAAVVQGFANKAADRIQLKVQINDVQSQKLLWSTNYDRDFKEIFKMQSETARGIASSLNVRLTTEEQRRLIEVPTTDFVAYDLYLRAKSLGLSENPTNNLATISLLKDATTKDPKFAEALAELAHAYGIKVFYFDPGDNDAFSKGLLAAQNAIALKSDLAAAYYAQGLLSWTHANGFNHELAIKAYARAIQLDSAFDDAHHQLALVYLHVGLMPETTRECDAALAINPGNEGARFRRAGALGYGGEFEEALAAQPGLARFNPSVWYTHTAWLQIYLGRTNEARLTIDEFLRKPEGRDDKGGQAAAIEAILLAEAGEMRQAEDKIKLAIERGHGFGHWHHAAHYIADAYALLNKPTEAMKFLKEAAADGLPCYTLFEADPILTRCLKNDSEFANFKTDLKERMEHFREIDRELFPPPAQ